MQAGLLRSVRVVAATDTARNCSAGSKGMNGLDRRTHIDDHHSSVFQHGCCVFLVVVFALLLHVSAVRKEHQSTVLPQIS
jgi:hypothetical protein